MKQKTTTTATATAALSSSTLKVLPITDVEDIPKLIDVWFAAFHIMGYMIPDTPKIRKWMDIGIHDDFKDESQIYVKVVDTATSDQQIVGYANWHWGNIRTWKERYPSVVDGMDVSGVIDRFFGREDDNRQRIVGGKRHYCTFLGG